MSDTVDDMERMHQGNGDGSCSDSADDISGQNVELDDSGICLDSSFSTRAKDEDGCYSMRGMDKVTDQSVSARASGEANDVNGSTNENCATVIDTVEMNRCTNAIVNNSTVTSNDDLNDSGTVNPCCANKDYHDSACTESNLCLGNLSDAVCEINSEQMTPTFAATDLLSQASIYSESSVNIDDTDDNVYFCELHLSFNPLQVKLQLQSGTYITRVNMHQRTPLLEFTFNYIHLDLVTQAEKRKAFLDIVTLLLDAGSDVNARDKHGSSVGHYLSTTEDHLDILKLFLDNGLNASNKDKKLETPLHIAVREGVMQIVTMLLDKKADIDAEDRCGLTPLHIASKGTPVHNASRGVQHTQLVSYLLRRGAAPNRRDRGGRTPLHLAARWGRVQNCEALLHGGARIYELDYSGQTPIHLAAAKDITGKTLACLAAEADLGVLEQQDAMLHETALHKAVKASMFENVKVLTRFKPNPNIPDVLGESALHKAASCHELVVWKVLLSLHADIDMPNSQNVTPYKKACMANNSSALALMGPLHASEA